MSVYNSFQELATAEGLNVFQQFHELVETYHNVHKSVYGFRPRYVNFDVMSIEELVEEIEQMSRIEPDYFTDEDDHKAWEAQQFEALVHTMLVHGAQNRRTAERWARQAS